LNACYELKEEGEEDQDIDLPEKLKKVEDVRQVLEKIDHYLKKKLGSSGVPLLYVVRDTVDLPDAVSNQGYGHPDLISEMI